MSFRPFPQPTPNGEGSHSLTQGKAKIGKVNVYEPSREAS